MTRKIPLIADPGELALRLDLSHCAVLPVDIQNDWCDDNGVFAASGNDVSILQRTVPRIEQFLAVARSLHVPIVHIGTCHSRWTDSPSWHARLDRRNLDAGAFLLPGTWGSQFYRIVPQSDEYVVWKHRYSAFVDTDLDLVLRSQGIRSLVMVGFATNVCVQNTAIHGFMRDYSVALLSDCTATFTEEDKEIALAYMGGLSLVVTESETLIDAWARIRDERPTTPVA